jgi:hypothetical protein
LGSAIDFLAATERRYPLPCRPMVIHHRWVTHAWDHLSHAAFAAHPENLHHLGFERPEDQTGDRQCSGWTQVTCSCLKTIPEFRSLELLGRKQGRWSLVRPMAGIPQSLVLGWSNESGQARPRVIRPGGTRSGHRAPALRHRGSGRQAP